MLTNERLKSRCREGNQNQNQTKPKWEDIALPTFLNTKYIQTHTYKFYLFSNVRICVRRVHVKIIKLLQYVA